MIREAIAGLLKTRDICNYNPTSPPRTEAKARAIVASEPTEVDDLRQLMNQHEDAYVFDHDRISILKLPNRGQHRKPEDSVSAVRLR